MRVLSPLPRRAAFPHGRVGNRLLPSPILCGLGARGFHFSGPQPVVHHVVTARALASLPSRNFVGRLRPWDFPVGRHPSYAASTFCRFRTFTLRIHEYLQTSHNLSENALRTVATGRKAWLFFGSDDTAEAAANLYSLIAGCKLHALDPERYLAEMIRVMPYWPRARFLELAPAYWAKTRARLDSTELEVELGFITVPPVLADAAEQSSPG